MTDRRRELFAELALVGIAAIWGATFTVVQEAIEELPTMAFLGYRFTAAALIVAIVFRHALRRLSPAGWRAGLLMGAFLTAGYVLQTLALEETTASNTGFITGLFVVITPVLAALLLRDRIGRLAWAAAAVSAFGLYLLSGTNGFNEGDGLALLARPRRRRAARGPGVGVRAVLPRRGRPRRARRDAARRDRLVGARDHR